MDGFLQGVGLVGHFPREAAVHTFARRSSEMAAAGGGGVDGVPQLQRINDALRREVEYGSDGLFQCRIIGVDRGTKGVHFDRSGILDADGVGQLDFASLGQSSFHQVLGHVAGHVGRRAVDFGGVLPTERPTTVAAHSTVGVHDDFSSR